jgi:hypothetical protein
MNHSTSKLRRIATLSSFMLGAFALSAVAQWVPAPNSPPECPTTTIGCNTPLNTGSSEQRKSGSLLVGLNELYGSTGILYTGGLAIFGDVFVYDPSAGNSGVTPGSVLTASSIGDGTVEWQPPSAAGATPRGIHVYDSSSASNTWTVPTGVTKIDVELWSAGQSTGPNKGRSGGYAYKHALPVTPGTFLGFKVGTDSDPDSWFGGGTYVTAPVGITNNGLDGKGDYIIQGSRWGQSSSGSTDGGDAPRGGSGVRIGYGTGTVTCYPARIPGGGGGSGSCSSSINLEGANGRIIITW